MFVNSILRMGVALVTLTSVSLSGEPKALTPLRFLLGEWETLTAAKPGEPTGRAIFERGLQDRVIVRTSYAEYPASGGNQGFRHDDMMIIYVDSDTLIKADYYDTEGHIVRYSVTPLEGNEVMFLSHSPPTAPRYRLTYKLNPDGTLGGRFEVALPGRPELFSQYLSWVTRKVNQGQTPPR